MDCGSALFRRIPPAAFFIFFAAAAGAGIIASYLLRGGFAHRPGRVGAVGGGGGGLGHLLPLGLLLGADLHRQHQMGGILPDGGDHLVEHVETLDAVHHHGILLPVGPQMDALAQLIHVVDVIHPVAIHCFQPVSYTHL